MPVEPVAFCGNYCARTNSDPVNCGGCNTKCSGTNIGTPTCSGGICNGMCNAGYSDCNGNKLLDGCEVNVFFDPANCGGCSMASTGRREPNRWPPDNVMPRSPIGAL